MIYVDVKGNLGNQLFEYALARKLQENYGQKICFNIYNLKKYRPNFKFTLTEYELNENIIVEEDKPMPWYANTMFPVTRAMKKFFPKLYFNILKKFGIYVWMLTKFIELPEIEQKNYYLSGYWQCTKYFDEIRPIILKELIPKKKLLDKNREFYNLILNSESVCITIRRGDFITNEKYKKKYFLCDEEYFYKAISIIKKRIPHVKFFIFSDDINWVKDNMNFGDNVFYESGQDDVLEKLRMMSACKYFIISNSSFSWWAQYLSENERKIVIAPSRWYASGEIAEIYDDRWILIEV